MRALMVALGLIVLAGILPGSKVLAQPASLDAAVNGAIERGLEFLVDDALAWKAEHNCASCHHAALVI